MVFGMVLLAALVTTGGDFLSLVAYGKWKIEHSSCSEQIASGKPALNRAAESVLKIFARGLEGADQSELWDASIRAEGRTLIFIHRFKMPMVNMDSFNRGAAIEQRAKLDMYCSNNFLKIIKPLLTETIYSSEGERLTSFSIGPADCPQ